MEANDSTRLYIFFRILLYFRHKRMKWKLVCLLVPWCLPVLIYKQREDSLMREFCTLISIWIGFAIIYNHSYLLIPFFFLNNQHKFWAIHWTFAKSARKVSFNMHMIYHLHYLSICTCTLLFINETNFLNVFKRND